MPADSSIPFRLVKRRLLSACRKLIQKDKELFQFGVNERTLTQRLSLYLQPKFPAYSVDCEYNRDLDDVKRMPVEPEKVLSSDIKGVTVFPDIVVHKRGIRDLNLLVIEAKKDADIDGVPDHDAKKLSAFTDQDGRFKYSSGAFLNFCREGDAVIVHVRWFWENQERSDPEVRVRARGALAEL